MSTNFRLKWTYNHLNSTIWVLDGFLVYRETTSFFPKTSFQPRLWACCSLNLPCPMAWSPWSCLDPPFCRGSWTWMKRTTTGRHIQHLGVLVVRCVGYGWICTMDGSPWSTWQDWNLMANLSVPMCSGNPPNWPDISGMTMMMEWVEICQVALK